MSRSEISRRELLSTLGAGGVALVGATGTAEAAAPARHVVGTNSPKATETAKRSAESVHHVLDFDDIGQAVAGRFTDEALEALERNPNVRYVEADGTMEAIGIDADDPEVPWGVDRVDAEKAHADGATGAGADVSIIDTGIDSDHPDLQSNLGTGKAVVSAKGPYAEKWDDDNGHGTHCAGIAGAADDGDGVVGVSTAATLHAVKVLDDGGSGYYSDVAAGLEWVADQGHDVGSLSLGGPTSKTIEDACQYAADRGVLLVAAAGNDGSDVEDAAPATYPTVVAVSATDSEDRLASFSNYGDDIELAAPGVNIYSTYVGGGYETLSGTSMACPHVSGAAGQLMAGGMGSSEARTRLADTAEDVGLSTAEQGSGLLDVEAAVSGTTDAAPSVSWVDPSDGETVSGSATVRIDASDAEDDIGTLEVTYTVDGGAPQSTTFTSAGYYEDSWDTTAVADGNHTLTATATDSAGNSSSRSITVATDNTESAPAVDSLSASEVETADADAEFDADWAVSDPDGDLSSVEVVLIQESDGSTEDAVTVDVGGDAASGTTRLVAANDDGSGNGYTVEVTVTDGSNASTDTTSVTETEETNSAPTVSIGVTDDSNPAWARYDVDWTVADADGDLSTVTTELRDSAGSALDSVSESVSGGSASGTHSVGTKDKRSASEVRVTVTDAAGESTSTTTTV